MRVVGVGLVLNLAASVSIFSWLLHHMGLMPAAAFFGVFLVAWGFFLIGFIVLVSGRHAIGAGLIAVGSVVFICGTVFLGYGVTTGWLAHVANAANVPDISPASAPYDPSMYWKPVAPASTASHTSVPGSPLNERDTAAGILIALSSLVGLVSVIGSIRLARGKRANATFRGMAG